MVKTGFKVGSVNANPGCTPNRFNPKFMKNPFLLAVMATVCTSLMSGCSKPGDNPTPTPVGPKSYLVEYRVTSATARKTAFFGYMNETGSFVSLDSLEFPVVRKFTRTMKTGDGLGLAASLPDFNMGRQEITGIILLDGKEVERKSSGFLTGNTVGANVSLSYVIR